jgi:hypothetical protein
MGAGIVDENKAAGIPARDVFAQSFLRPDIEFWIKNDPDFGKARTVCRRRATDEGDRAQGSRGCPGETQP